MKKDYKVAVAGTGSRDIIHGCHNRDKGTAENERLRNLKFIFSYPKNERLIVFGWQKCRTGRNLDHEGGVTASGQVHEPIRSLCCLEIYWFDVKIDEKNVLTNRF